MEIDKGLLGGSAPLLLLSLLRERDYYGYEIIRELDRRSDSTFRFQEGTLYPVLHKLENQGLVTAYSQTGETGRPRRYYRLTYKGKRRLAREEAQWRVFSRSVERVIGGDAHALA